MSSLASSTTSSLSSIPLRTLYTRMLLTRLVDERLQALCQQGHIEGYASCQGHEAAQVGSAMCIEVGQDFTLPYYRDLGVVLTIGMTVYEAIRTCLSTYTPTFTSPGTEFASDAQKPPLQWSYHKRNMVRGSASPATHILHAAGIAFASKLRKAAAVTVAYCGDGATTEADFLEGLRFSALHRLPVIFICEQECSAIHYTQNTPTFSCFESLPDGLIHKRIAGTDSVRIYETMQESMEQVRAGNGPVLLELAIVRAPTMSEHDPLICCEQMLQTQGLWDEQWAATLRARLCDEVEQAVHNALHDRQSTHVGTDSSRPNLWNIPTERT